MASRGNESPMDFTWHSGGPVDPTSPFVKASSKKRPHATFDSPSKNTFPSFREPNGKPFLFSSPAKNLPTSPYREPSFTTPRKPFDLDFSSGPESSPVAPTDNDDTPDGKPLPAIPSQPKTKKRNSLFSFYGRWAPSVKSGKGEISKPKTTSDTIAKRVHKRRRQAQAFEKQLVRATRESEESDNDSYLDTPSPTKRKASKSQQAVEDVSWITGLFTFIHTYPDAPTIIAKYLQVFFNAVILFGCLYMFYSFYATIRADVDKASNDAYQEILAEMAACTKNYMDNRCESRHRAPALENVCNNWELCMNRDPNAVKRARLSAHTFAEIFNSFVEPISLKTMTFTALIVGLALLINNATFTIYRRSQEHHDGYRGGSGQYGMHPGPHTAQMGQFAMTPGLPYQTPHQYGWQAQEQPGQRQLGYDDSPTKDRGKSRSPEKKRLALEN